jgi:hypothetical protein
MKLDELEWNGAKEIGDFHVPGCKLHNFPGGKGWIWRWPTDTYTLWLPDLSLSVGNVDEPWSIETVGADALTVQCLLYEFMGAKP